MKMKKLKHLFGRNLGFLIAVVFFTLVYSNALQAQNVTIRANNGSTIAAVKNGGVGDTFFNVNGFATWQHEQLSMVLTTSDGTMLTPNGQLDNPANNLFSDNNGHMQIAKGQLTNANICYVTLSLPKGYRFTGYTIKFSKPYYINKGRYSGQDIVFNPKQNANSTFGETNSTFSTYTTSAEATTGGSSKEISRTEMNEGEMSNVLYFKLQSPSNERALITLESAEFFFTTEENYSPVTPAGEITTPVSAVDVPFATSKVDFGTIESRLYQGSTRVSYSSANVKDLEGNFKLYEAESLEDGTDLDNIQGKVVKYQDGTISSDGGYFKLGRSEREQIYYIESPTTVTVSDGHDVPVGYRIVGAEFEYTNKVGAYRTFYITYTVSDWFSSSPTTYYLGIDGRFSTTRTIWEMDEEGYISSGGYYLYFNNGRASTQYGKPAETERFGINENGIYQLQYPEYYICYYQYTSGWQTIREGQISKDNTDRASYEEIEHHAPVGDYTLYIYDKEGKNPQEIEVNSSNAGGKVKLENLNNDAVKFGVKGIGLIRATLTLQALDPYINDMSVVCQAKEQTVIRIAQTFTASDFSVSGGEFYFYLPKDQEEKEVAITFEDLHSKYFDESYDGGSSKHTSRLNFVKSVHYNAFGESDNCLYNDRDEASNAVLERQKVGTVGTAKFTFNNAEEVGVNGGTLREFPFSLEKYREEGGDFDKMEFTVKSYDQSLKRYVFTTDETRYNIAPTTATQHRAYAFYEMIVHVQSNTYEPKVAFKKIYDKTFHGEAKEDAFYGVEVTAEDGQGKAGYSSAAEIFKHINRAIENKKDDFGNTDVPSDQKYILYLDFSKMAGVYQTTDSTHTSMEDFSAGNGANCLVFLPEGASASNDNVATKMASGIFHAVRNIILTDKEPFYSPYTIQVDAANYAKHERMITVAKNGKVTSATIIMPFQISIDEDGNHTNFNETEPAFSLHTMQATNCITDKAPADAIPESVASYAFFPSVENLKISEPNKPYIVKVLNPGEDDKTSFVITQSGTRINPTTDMNPTDYTFTGETAEGFLDGIKYSFTNKGTFSGIKLPKNDGYYYFANNKFVCSNDLKDSYTDVKVYPFRAYYSTGTQNANLMSTFAIVFGKGEGNTDPTGINNVDETPDLVVAPGIGTITMASTIEQGVKIYNMNGVLVDKVMMGAGETQTINIPTGMYIVNGIKLIVR